jgi:hypothetical protein
MRPVTFWEADVSGLAAIGAAVVLIFVVVGGVRLINTVSFKSPTDNKDKSEK